jgi:hypothetical protein
MSEEKEWPYNGFGAELSLVIFIIYGALVIGFCFSYMEDLSRNEIEMKNFSS